MSVIDPKFEFYEYAIILDIDFSNGRKLEKGTIFVKEPESGAFVYLKRARTGEMDRQLVAIEDICNKEVIINPENGGVMNYDSAKIKKDDKNYGGDTDYYRVPENAKMLQDLIEYKKMNFAEGNMFKATYRLNDGDHDKVRELNKIIWFAEREKKRIKKEKSKKKEGHVPNEYRGGR